MELIINGDEKGKDSPEEDVDHDDILSMKKCYQLKRHLNGLSSDGDLDLEHEWPCEDI